MQDGLRKKFLAAEVRMVDSATVYFYEDTVIGSGVMIEPFVVFGPGVVIEDNVTVKSFSHIEKTRLRSGTSVGPFARLRGGADIGPNVQIGDFVEVKNSRIHDGAKANHLAYIGDAEVGAKTNVGAGVITCNYDGFDKFKTTIGENSFIGCNTALVAPVTVEDNAIIGAGSVITKDAPKDSLTFSRPEQKTIPDGATKFRNRRNKPKE